MENSTLTEYIISKIGDYFANENMNKAGVTDEVSKILLASVDCSQINLLNSLNEFCSLKKNTDSGIYSRFGEMMEVSDPNEEKIYVRAFLTSDYSKLHFFRNTEKLPFFKLKLSLSGKEREVVLESSNDSTVFANHGEVFHKSPKEDEGLYVVQNKYYFDDSAIVKNSNNYMKSGLKKDFESSRSMDSLSGEYAEFYRLFSRVQAYNGIKMPEKLSETECELMFSQFYDKVDGFLSYENEFSLETLLKIINNFMYEDTFLNEVVEASDNDASAAAWINRCTDMDGFGRTGDKIKAEISKIDGVQLTIIVKKAVGDKFKDVCNYMIWNTGEGFTLYRRILDANSSLFKSSGNSLVLNFSADEIRFTLLGNNMRNAPASVLKDKFMSFVDHGPLELDLKFNQNGQIELNSNEVTYNVYDQPTYQNIGEGNQFLN